MKASTCRSVHPRSWVVATTPDERQLDRLRRAKTILLTTYKRDGSPVATPVSIAFDGDRAYFRSYDKAWKTKRLARNPHVEAAPCTIAGERIGPGAQARARLLSGQEARVAARALAQRHKVLQRVLVPLTHRLMRYRTMHYELVFDRAG
jgi:PPOX class probable F420-dependent enzyme